MKETYLHEKSPTKEENSYKLESVWKESYKETYLNKTLLWGLFVGLFCKGGGPTNK